MKTGKNDRIVEKVVKGTRKIGALVVGKKEKSKLSQENPTRRLLPGRFGW